MRSRTGLFQGRGVRRLMLRTHKADAADPEDASAFIRSREASRWPELKTMVRHIETIAETIAQEPVDIGRIYLEWLDTGATINWRRLETPYYQRFWRLHLPLRTNPFAMTYSGVEAVQILPGQLTQVNVLAPHSAINLGETPRVHLILDVAKAVKKTESP